MKFADAYAITAEVMLVGRLAGYVVLWRAGGRRINTEVVDSVEFYPYKHMNWDGAFRSHMNDVLGARP